jgi:transposase
MEVKMNIGATSQRIDHLGVIAGVIKDLKLVELIDERIATDSREEISTGEAVAAMIINGLGFSDRPMTLTPQFFENKALNILFRPEVNASHFNRFKLGRALDNCHLYGCDALFAEISLKVCQQEGIDTRFNSLDTTSFSLTGEYDSDFDEHTILITHGYSKDHRPDLKQVVLEMMTSHDGGIPIVSKSWNGNASDAKIFRERAHALIKSFKDSKTPHYLIADSKLYDSKTADVLEKIPFITRIPGTIKLEEEMIKKALQKPLQEWEQLDDTYRFQRFEVEHYNLKQRWIVVSSQEAQSRGEKRIKALCEKEKEKLEDCLKKLSSEKFSCPSDAHKSLEKYAKGIKFHDLEIMKITERKIYLSKGRPHPDSPYEIKYQVHGIIKEVKEAKKNAIQEASCFIIATTIPIRDLSDKETILAYKNQNTAIEKGFRFLKDPLMFTSSLFVKKSERIMGLLMVMTLSLLVYSIAQRRLHQTLKKVKGTLPNQIRKEISNPTLRWIFQLLDGVEIVHIKVNNTVTEVISGLTDLRRRILSHFSESVRKMYKLHEETAPTF